MTGCSRAQSHVVGVALMLALAVFALGTLTVGVGTIVDSQAAGADAQRMAESIEQVTKTAERTGYATHSIRFSDGQLYTEDRTVRILEGGSVIQTHEAKALIFENDEYRITAIAGAVLRDTGQGASLVADPSITSSQENGVVVIGIPVLNGSHLSVGGQEVTKTLEANVSHERTALGTGEYGVAIETERPETFERYFEDTDGTTHRRTFAGDDRESIVVTFPGNREGYVVRHGLQLEVTN